MAWLQAVVEGLALLRIFLGWWVKLDDAKRKEIRSAFQQLQEAEKHGTQGNMRSAINRLNANLN